MLQAKPKRLSEEYRVAECDPSGGTEYLLAPLPNSVAMVISGIALSEAPAYDPLTGEQLEGPDGEPLVISTVNPGIVGIENMRYMLQGLKGVIDPDTKNTLELKFIQKKHGDKNHKCLQAGIIDRLPDELYIEIAKAVTKMCNAPKGEMKNENFTSSSAGGTNSTSADDAPDTSDVPTGDASKLEACDEPTLSRE